MNGGRRVPSGKTGGKRWETWTRNRLDRMAKLPFLFLFVVRAQRGHPAPAKWQVQVLPSAPFFQGFGRQGELFATVLGKVPHAEARSSWLTDDLRRVLRVSFSADGDAGFFI